MHQLYFVMKTKSTGRGGPWSAPQKLTTCVSGNPTGPPVQTNDYSMKKPGGASPSPTDYTFVFAGKTEKLRGVCKWVVEGADPYRFKPFTHLNW